MRVTNILISTIIIIIITITITIFTDTNDTENPGTLHEIRNVAWLPVYGSRLSLPFKLYPHDWSFQMRQKKPGDFVRTGVEQRVASHKVRVENVMQEEVARAGLFHCG